MEDSIDLVYMWVDGNDPKWLDKKNSFLENKIKSTSIAGRYENNNEFMYSLRSIDTYLPWIRKIFIITDNQIPIFIDVNNPKIIIIDHSEIIPLEVLPTFNSVVIDYFIHNIPDLSEKFLLANDDFFVNSHLSPDFFFKQGKPILRMISSKRFFLKLRFKSFFRMDICDYHAALLNACKLIKYKYDKYYPLTSHHNIDAYLKSDYQKTAFVFYDDIKKTLKNRFRSDKDIQRILFDFAALARGNAFLSFSSNKESCLISVDHGIFSDILDKYNPSLFCLNDTEYTTDKDRKRIVPFLNSIFPNKCNFEK